MRIKPRLLAAAAVAGTCALIAAVVPTVTSKAGAAAPVTYTYDANGRIHSVNNGTTIATYAYDAAGNVTSITYTAGSPRAAASSRAARPARPSISQVGPSPVRSGERVTITGRGFDPVAGDDVVRIGSLVAPVVSATSTALVVSAPPGAGGAVNVRTPAGDVTKGSVRILGTGGPGGVAAPTNPLTLRGALRAHAGVTALSGLVERNDGKPLAGIRISINDGWDSSQASTTTNSKGWFLLTDLTSGSHVLYIDGGSDRYGLYTEPVSLPGGVTTVLPWITYLTPLDMSASVSLPRVTSRPVTLESSHLPGLEVVIPKGTRITDANGAPVSRVSLTALATNRTPFPWAPNMEPPYFTLQPEGVHVSGPGLKVIYPNQSNQPPGTKLSYLANSPGWGGSGWYTYGGAHVSADGKQVVPDPGNTYHEIVPGGYTTPPGPGSGPGPGGGPGGGEPVDLYTGLFTLGVIDLSLSDALSVSLGRVYRPLDDMVRTFGIGTESSLDYFVQSDNQGNFDLYLPDGGKIVYKPTTTSGVYDATGTPTAFFASTLTQQGDSDGPFQLALTDGTKMEFSNPAYLIQVTDRFGNTININRNDFTPTTSGGGQINTVTTPGGQWMQFTYGVCVPGTNPSYCVTSVTDSAGRTVSYSYDTSGQLTGVVAPNGAKTTYQWGACTSQITCTEITAASHGSVQYISNTYDPSTGRVTAQTVGDGGQWSFSYITNSSGQVTQTNVTDPDGHLSEYTFDANGYESQGTTGAGSSVQQVVTPVYDPTTNLLDSYTDALGRKTTFTYDPLGNLLTETLNATSSTPSTYTYTYEPTFNRVASITNPLSQTTTFTYNDSAHTVTTTDPLGKSTVTTLNNEGQPIQVTDSLGNNSYFSYLNGQLVAYADPLGNVTGFYDNSLGEPISVTNPQGHVTHYTWTDSGDVFTQTDPLGGKTTYAHNGAGELLSITDPDHNKTSFTYDGMLRPLTETDALGKAETVTYDGLGRVLTSTDRNGNKSTFSYDALGRLSTAKSGVVGSTSFDTVTYTYDAANRLTKVVDSKTGTYKYTYDNLDDLLTVSAPNGTLTYTYDLAGNETSAAVGGQTAINYAYNADGNVKTITQGTTKVTIGYDADQRTTSTALPDGISETATYNADSQVTNLAYAHGSTSLGNLAYTYNIDGQVLTVSGTLATTNLPAAVASATYNADNEMTKLGSTSMTYDAEGDLLSNGTSTYAWNPEDQLSSVTTPSGTSSFTYNPFGQRASETVGATTTSYLYDGNNVVQTQSGGSPVANMITNGLDQTYQVSNSAGTFSLLADRLGSTIGLGGTTGTVGTTYAYDPFGVTTTSGTANPNAAQFTGAQNDTSTGLYYLDARYYSPTLERFISQDPIGFAGGTPDLYQYGYNQPTSFVDPLGTSGTNVGGDGGGGNNGGQGDYHGTANHHPTIHANGMGHGSGGSGGTSGATTIAAAAQNTAAALFAGQTGVYGTGGATSDLGLSPLSAVTGTPEAVVASTDAALLLEPDTLPLSGNELLGSRPWSTSFWNGQAPW